MAKTQGSPELCCRWPGFVNVVDPDIAAISGFFKIEESEFIQHFIRLRQYRDGLALLDKANGECVFLKGKDFSIQPVKPRQCRGFPNEWNFPGWREAREAVEMHTGR